MLDDRKPIASGTLLAFDEKSRYTVLEEVGRGASCIVYSAYYKDLVGCRHFVRIKECCPYHMGIQRQEDGKLCVPDAYQCLFARAKEKFHRAYENHAAVKGMLGLVNSTVDAANLYEYRDTLYVVTACVEGTDYRADLDEDLKSVFTRIAALARIIKKYHAHGLLHLDIKPENMLIIPETKEHLVLFDFDSLLEKDEIKDAADERISFSDGYAAPELVGGNKKKICEAADVYSIGAVVFYKLFGRTPDALDSSVGTTYDFTNMHYHDKRYQPELFQKLSEFLHRSIAASVTYRYRTIDELQEQLKLLIRLSDLNQPFLYHNFSYRCACFAGRSLEIEQIGSIFAGGQQVLFLSGIGGIGKTELAKRYAYENESRYKKIVFVPFTDSIEKTVCGDDLRIHQMEQNEGEPDGDYFKRKLKLLKDVTSPDDLVILDNFDVEADDCLEALFACPCRFLVTTRRDFRDYNYVQKEVGRITRMEELLQLFWNYYDKVCGQEETEQVEHLIELVDRHTMTVELTAKYLRISGEPAASLLQRMMKKEGILSMPEIKVMHRKDQKLRAASINEHLLLLFDLSVFSEVERELIRSLSLLGYVRILKDKFLELCPVKGNAAALETLIHRGFVEYEDGSGKVSLHQIILDLVYNYLNPNAENCPHLVDALTAYAEQKPVNNAERSVRNRLLGNVMKRLEGAEILYAKLCLRYCQNVSNHIEYLDKAYQILSEKDAPGLMQQVCRKKIARLAAMDDLFEQVVQHEETGTEFSYDAYFEELSLQVCELAKKAYDCAKAYRKDAAWLAEFCVSFAWELDEASASNMLMMDEEYGRQMERILDFAVCLMDDAERYLGRCQMEPEKKRRLYRRMGEFFGNTDLTNLYRLDHYTDMRRAMHYEEKMEQECGQEDILYLDSFSTFDLAYAALEKKDYQEAIQIYKQAWEQGKEEYGQAWYQIACVYLQMGEVQKAVESLQKILEADYRRIQETGDRKEYTSYVSADLIRLLMQEQRYKEAERYAKELLLYNQFDAQQDENAYARKWMVAGSFYLYELAQKQSEREARWQECLQYFEKLPASAQSEEELAEFLLAYTDRLETTEQKLQAAFAYERTYSSGYHKKAVPLFLDYILSLCADCPKYAEERMLALLRYSLFFMEGMLHTDQERKKALPYAEQAKALYQDAGIKNDYLESLLYHIFGEYWQGCSGEYDSEKINAYKSKCNYYLLAEHHSSGKTQKEQIDIWEDAAREYRGMDNYAMEAQCFQKLFAIPALLHETEFSKYADLAAAQIRCALALKQKQQVYEGVWDLYARAVTYFAQPENERQAGELWRQTAYCAELFAYAGIKKEAAVLYIVAVIAALKPDIDAKSLRAKEAARDRCIRLAKEAARLLHGRITAHEVDVVLEIYEKLAPLLEEEEGLLYMKEEMEWFLKVYQYGDVEFKR